MSLMPEPLSAPAQLKSLLEKRCAVAAPGCHDPFGALLIAEAGFVAMSFSGYSFAASLAKPDIGLISGTQMTDQATAIARTVSQPVLADADTGYGGISNIAETVRAYERGGVAGLHLEDQVNPKRCGAMASKALPCTSRAPDVSLDQLVQRIELGLGTHKLMQSSKAVVQLVSG